MVLPRVSGAKTATRSTSSSSDTFGSRHAGPRAPTIGKKVCAQKALASQCEAAVSLPGRGGGGSGGGDSGGDGDGGRDADGGGASGGPVTY